MLCGWQGGVARSARRPLSTGGKIFFLAWKKKNVSPFCFFPLSAKLAICLVLNTIQVEPGALRAPGRGPPAELSRLMVFRETQQVRNSRYEILENKAWRVVE